MGGDITAVELLDLLADDEMIESGYDREGMVALILLCRAALQVLSQELAELRAGQEAAIDEALRRQAAAAIRRVELSDPLGPELGAALALVPRDRDLIVRHPSDCEADAAWQEPFAAGPFDPPRGLATGYGPTREAAIMAATRKLLGLSEDELRRRVSGSPAEVVRAAMALVDAWAGTSDYECEVAMRRLVDAVERLRGAAEPRQTCGTCAHWQRGAEPAKSGDGTARPCARADGTLRHPGGWCDEHSSAADTEPAPSSGDAS